MTFKHEHFQMSLLKTLLPSIVLMGICLMGCTVEKSEGDSDTVQIVSGRGFDFQCENPFNVLDSLQSSQIKIQNLRGSSFDQLWSNIGLALKKLEVTIEDAEGGGVGVQVIAGPTEIRVEHFESCGLYVSEVFSVAHRTNELALITYRNKTGCTSWYQFGATWVAIKTNSQWNITDEIPGMLELTPMDIGNKTLLVTDKSIKSSAWLTPCTEHLIFVFDPFTNSIAYRQSVGKHIDRDANGNALSPRGDRTGTKLSLTNRADTILLTVTESYRNLERPEVNRKFRWNANKELFEELE
jgi:hypothetical protein